MVGAWEPPDHLELLAASDNNYNYRVHAPESHDEIPQSEIKNLLQLEPRE